MSCLDDADDSIRLRALDLLSGMVSKKNLMEIVKKLMSHMAKAEGTTYRFVYSRLSQCCGSMTFWCGSGH
jgi:AP-3 complex subunit delta-1